jgi:uncharacterized protein (DUF427 family)
MLLCETGLPNRYYLPPQDVQRGLLTPSSTRTRCPYKGEATYYNLTVAGRELSDAVWCFVHSLPDGPHIAGSFCFHHKELTIETERQP